MSFEANTRALVHQRVCIYGTYNYSSIIMYYLCIPYMYLSLLWVCEKAIVMQV